MLKSCIVWLAFTLTSAVALPQAQTSDQSPFQLSAHHATISVTNMDEMSRWYQRVLGFREKDRVLRAPGRLVCHLTIPGYRLDLLSQLGSVRQTKKPNGLVQGWVNIVFLTPSLEAASKHLLAKGVTARMDRDKDNALEHLTFYDPEGNEIGMTSTP